MQISTSLMSENDASKWDSFVDTQSNSSLYHLYSWQQVINASYAHSGYFLLAKNKLKPQKIKIADDINFSSMKEGDNSYNEIAGILPLFQIKHWLFGNSLISIPYFDSAGILADSPVAGKSLLSSSIDLAKVLDVSNIEIRNTAPIWPIDECPSNMGAMASEQRQLFGLDWTLSLHTNKVRMVLPLPSEPGLLMKSFKAKLRSQIRRAEKEGLIVKQGRQELIHDFYQVFATNMRDLGSPVHSKKLFLEVLKRFPKTSHLFVVYGNKIPMACALVIGFKDLLANPWASSLRQYSYCAPNMLLYWAMMEFGCQNKYAQMDLGRCTHNGNAYKFKAQWGSAPVPIYWYSLNRKENRKLRKQPEKDKLGAAMACWKMLPVTVTKLLGPPIRRFISL